METGGIRTAGYMAPYDTGNRKKSVYGKAGGFETEDRGGDRKLCADTIAQDSVMDIFDRLKKGGRNIPARDDSAGEFRPEESGQGQERIQPNETRGRSGQGPEELQADESRSQSEQGQERIQPDENRNQNAGQEESETETQIIVRPDGSRVLLVTMSVGGMETTMSLELSKPTDMQNEYRQENSDENVQQNMETASLAEAAGEGAEE